MYRRKIHLLLVLFLFYVYGENDLFAQARVYTIENQMKYFDKVIEMAGISFQMPRNCIQLDSIGQFIPVFHSVYHFPGKHFRIIQSKDKHFAVFVCAPYACPALPDSVTVFTLSPNHAQFDSNLAHRAYMLENPIEEIQYVISKQARCFFNADSVITYRRNVKSFHDIFVSMDTFLRNYKLEEDPFWTEFPYCKVMILHKRNRGFIPLYLFFTEKGWKHEKKYTRLLNGILRYD